jgi:hypothetical protein
MRRHLWLAILLGTVSFFGTADSALSQGVYPPGGGMESYPPGATMGGSPVGEFTGMAPPGGAYPSYYQPYPSISPYEHEFTQIANRGGIWESESENRISLPSRWKFRTEYVQMKAERGRYLIGNPNAPSYREQIAPVLDAAGGGAGGGNLTDYVDALRGTNNGVGFNLFDPITAKQLDRPELQGLRLTLSGENPDGSGIEMWGFWASEDDNEFDAREDVHPSRGNQQVVVEAILQGIDETGIPFLLNPPISLTNFPDPLEILQENLLNLRGIPLDDGTITRLSDGTTFGGASAVYDLAFQVRTDIDMYGTGLRWKSMPLYKSGSIRVRPSAGLRYTAVRDMFGFFGRDSGIFYDTISTGNQPFLPDVKLHSLPNGFDDDGDGIVDNAGLIEDQFGGQGGGGGGGGAQGAANFGLIGDPRIYPVTSILDNQVESHLGGPEIGIDYDFGGDKGFRLGGSTNVGLLVNYQRIELSGDNIFVSTRESDLIFPSETNARPNTFSTTETHTSVSPMIEQMIYGEGPLFQYIPVLRRSKMLRNANFRASYTLTMIAEMTRASDSIIWQGNPSQNIFPGIQTSRSTFRTSSYDFGISWSW